MENFSSDGYILLKNKMPVLKTLEEITKRFVELPETKGKYMKYFEGEDRKLSRIEYMIDFDEDLKQIEDVLKLLISMWCPHDNNFEYYPYQGKIFASYIIL